MSLRTWWLVPGSLETPTGGYIYDRRIIDGLRTAGVDVHVCELDDTFPQPTTAAREAAMRMLDAIPDGEIVVVDGLAFGALATEAEAHAKRLRLVALVHHPLALETGISEELAATLRESERRALAAARHVVVTSSATAATLADFGVHPPRLTVIEPGTDRAPLAHGSGGGEVHLLTVASLTPRKGHLTLVRALTALDDLPWQWTCVGPLDRDAPTVALLRARLAAAGWEHRVHLRGELAGNELEDAYRSADVFVLPSLYEGYGMVVAEALAHGLPVIATATGAIPQLVGNDAGRVVAPGDAGALADALGEFIADAQARQRFRDGALRRRERLRDWFSASRDFARVVERIASGQSA